MFIIIGNDTMFFLQEFSLRFCKIGSRYPITSSGEKTVIHLWDRGLLGTDQNSWVRPWSASKLLYWYNFWAPSISISELFKLVAFRMSLKCSALYLAQFRLTSPHLLASGDGVKSANIVGDVYVHPSAKIHPTAKVLLSFHLLITAFLLQKVSNIHFRILLVFITAI